MPHARELDSECDSVVQTEKRAILRMRRLVCLWSCSRPFFTLYCAARGVVSTQSADAAAL